MVWYCIGSAITGTPRFNPRVRVTHHHSTLTGLMPIPKQRDNHNTYLNPVNADFSPLFLKPNIITVTLYYPKPLSPDAALTRAAGGGGKPGHISTSRDMPVKPQHPAGDSQTTYIPMDLFHLHFENSPYGIGMQLRKKCALPTELGRMSWG